MTSRSIVELFWSMIFKVRIYSGAILFRPTLERLRDAIAGGQVERICVHAPDLLARRYAPRRTIFCSRFKA
jgi:hypothetical protein